jgi:hypothetical protein
MEKSEDTLKKSFILSSFTRQKIAITPKVMALTNKILSENWDFSQFDLTEIDNMIKERYYGSR